MVNYEGGYLDGKYHGFGTLRDVIGPDPFIYTGEFKMGVRDGCGEHFSNVTYYRGNRHQETQIDNCFEINLELSETY